MCQFMDIVKEDFAYYLGDDAGSGLDACYNDVPLIVAYNMTASLDFAGPIEEQLGAMDMDIGAEFAAVKDPIIELGATISNITIVDEVALFSDLTAIGTTLEAELYSQSGGKWIVDSGSVTAPDGTIHRATDVAGAWVVVQWDDPTDVPVLDGSGDPIFVPWPDWDKCCYDDTYTEGNIMEPWLDNAAKVAMTCTGTLYARLPNETPLEYMTRLYSAASCEDVNSVLVNDNIIIAYETMFDLLTAKDGMLADLGTDAVFCSTRVCPTPQLGYPTTILQAMNDYEGKMDGLVDEFAVMGDTMVGNLVRHVEDFACNMRCQFVAAFMNELQQNWCVDMLAGFLDIAVSLVLLAVFNVPVCICAAILVTRFRGKWRLGSCFGADEGGKYIGDGKVAPENGVDEDGDGDASGDVEESGENSGESSSSSSASGVNNQASGVKGLISPKP